MESDVKQSEQAQHLTKVCSGALCFLCRVWNHAHITNRTAFLPHRKRRTRVWERLWLQPTAPTWPQSATCLHRKRVRPTGGATTLWHLYCLFIFSCSIIVLSSIYYMDRPHLYFLYLNLETYILDKFFKFPSQEKSPFSRRGFCSSTLSTEASLCPRITSVASSSTTR